MKLTPVSNPAIREAFAACRREKKPAFIPFLMGGYPTYEDSIAIALALQEAGAAIMEVGLPYSDPLADGPTIQAASEAALKQGMTFSKGLELIEDLRKAGVTIPLLVFSYYNPVYQYGFERFVTKAKQIGANGVLIPDMPNEETEALRAISSQHQFDFISFVAPTSKQRIKEVTSGAQGFVYCISSLGVTGARDQLSAGIESFLDEVRTHTDVPLAVGFGVSKPEHVQLLSQKADGIIIGTALIHLIAERMDHHSAPSVKHEALSALKNFVKDLFSDPHLE